MALYRRFPRYVDFTDFTPVIPEIYWNVYSSEQRIRALCCEWVKLVAYVDGMADTVNDQYKIIEDMEARLPELVNADVVAEIQRLIESGQFKQFIEQAIADFEAEIRGDITALQNGLSSETANRSSADTALGNRIDAEQAARSNADTALGNRVTEEASARSAADTALGNRLDALGNRVNTLENENSYFAVIGDSFSNESSEWPTMLANATGLNLINKSANGAGFTTGNKTFLQQFNELIQNANWPKTKYLIIYGGINDFNDANATPTEMQSAFSDLRNAIVAQSHKPTVIMAFGNMGFARLARYATYGAWYYDCLGRATYYFPGVIQNVPYWLWSGSNFESDNLHPNNAGHRRIMNYMLNIINGGYSGVHFQRSINVNNANGEGNVTLRFDNSVITIDYELIIKNTAHNTYLQIADFSSSQTWTFGSIGGREDAHLNTLVRFPGLTTTTPTPDNSAIAAMEIKEFYFNKASGVVYYRLRGNNITTENFTYTDTHTCGV